MVICHEITSLNHKFTALLYESTNSKRIGLANLFSATPLAVQAAVLMIVTDLVDGRDISCIWNHAPSAFHATGLLRFTNTYNILLPLPNHNLS